MSRLDRLKLSVLIDEVAEEGGESFLRSVISPPLGCGLQTTEVPRSPTELLVARRRAQPLVGDSHLAQLVLRTAMTASASFAEHGLRVFVSDSEVTSERDVFTDEEIEVLARLVEAIVLGMHSVVGRQPRAPWKQLVDDAWSPLVSELGATFQRDELRLTVKRGSLEAVVFVVLDAGNLITRVDVPLVDVARGSLSEVQADERVKAHDASVRVLPGKLQISRTGLVASATHLASLIDVAFAVAVDVSRGLGPYR